MKIALFMISLLAGMAAPQYAIAKVCSSSKYSKKDSKENRNTLLRYVSSSYNEMRRVACKLGQYGGYGLKLRGPGKFWCGRDIPLSTKIGKRENQAGLAMFDKYGGIRNGALVAIGKKLEPIHDVVNGTFSRWTCEHRETVFALVEEINKIEKEFLADISKHFKKTGKDTMSDEPTMKIFMGSFPKSRKTWKELDK